MVVKSGLVRSFEPELEMGQYNNNGRKVAALAGIAALAVGGYLLFKDAMSHTAGAREGIEAFEKSTHPKYNHSPTLEDKTGMYNQ